MVGEALLLQLISSTAGGEAKTTNEKTKQDMTTEPRVLLNN